MKEIGGYIELDTYHLPMLHDQAVALNCGRSCLAYLLEARRISKIALPFFLCDSVRNICLQHNVRVRFYSISEDFLPCQIELESNEWMYVVNYYGQLTVADILELKKQYPRLILDHAQAYFNEPLPGVDTIYTCRKFFGVPDGAFLYTDARLNRELPRDESRERMGFLLGRFERTASEFYAGFVENNHLFDSEPVKKMSRLTDNLLHGVDYQRIKQVRTENYRYLEQDLGKINRLKLRMVEGAFAYPLWLENGAEIRRRLQGRKIYIPTLWPNVLEDVSPDTLEYDFADNVLPLPVDQRYTSEEMRMMKDAIIEFL